MGNTPSSEAPRKPQKLSKPRVGAHAAAAAAATAAAGLPSPKTASAPGHGRYSNSYLVGSLPTAAAAVVPEEEQPLKPASSPAIGIAVPIDHERPLRTPRTGSRRNSKRWSGLFDFNSSSSDQQLKRSSIAGAASISIPSAKAGSAQQQEQPLSKSLPRTESALEGSGDCGGTARCNLSFEEFQRFILTHETIYEPVIARTPSRAQVREVTESTWKSCHPLQPENTSISRTDSQASVRTGAGVPVRRRSLIQTPGVATRSHEHSQRISGRSSFRNSLPATPSLSQQDSRESLTTRRMSMPSPQVDLDPHVRMASPCERNYQQVGGMKFGSLRVTNGMPELSPPLDGETKAQQELQPELGYFGKSLPNSPVTNGPPNGTLNLAERSEPPKVPARKADGNDKNDNRDSRNDATTVITFPTAGIRIVPATGPESNLTQVEKKHEGTELLDIKEDPNANAKEDKKKVPHVFGHKTVKTLSGADSGFMPSPSSETSRNALSKADSGYSSNVSLPSFRSLKRFAGDESQRPRDMLKSRIPERTSSMTAKSTQRPRVRRHDRSKSELPPPPPPPPKDEGFPVPTRKSSLSSLARDTMNRIPALRNSVASRDSTSRDSNSSRKKSSLTDRSITKADIGAPVPLAADSEGALDSKLQSPLELEALRTRNLLGNGNDMAVNPAVPRKPVPGETKEPESHRPKAPSQEIPGSIPRTSSADVPRKAPQSKNRKQVVEQNAQEIVPKSSPPRKRSLHSLSRSFSQAKANLKKAVDSKHPVPPISHSKSDTPKTEKPEAGRLRPKATAQQAAATSQQQRGSAPRSIPHGNSAMAPTIRTVPGDASSLPLRVGSPGKVQAKMKTAGRSHISPIKTSTPAPNMEDPNWPLSPPVVPELAHLRRKTPPPVSMRTRSLKNLRVPSPARSHSAPPGEIPTITPSPVARNRSRDSMHSHRSSPGTTTPKTGKLSPIMDDSPSGKQETERSSSGRTTRHVRSKSQPGRLRKHPQRDYHQIHGTASSHEPFQTGIAIPYPDMYRGRSPSHHRSRSEVQRTGPNWQLSHALGKELPVPPVPPKPSMSPDSQDANLTSTPRSPGHSRHGSGSSVLHSYNSSAYRGVPTRS